MEKWHVYQLRSDTELLYVGHARRLKIRLDQHRQQKPWWPEVARVQSEEFATKDQAILREKELWAGGRPKYNRASPFRTDEESRQHSREYDRKRRQTAEYKQRQSAANRTPEHRAYMRAFSQKPEQRMRNRERQRVYRARRRQQAGPGSSAGVEVA